MAALRTGRLHQLLGPISVTSAYAKSRYRDTELLASVSFGNWQMGGGRAHVGLSRLPWLDKDCLHVVPRLRGPRRDGIKLAVYDMAGLPGRKESVPSYQRSLGTYIQPARPLFGRGLADTYEYRLRNCPVAMQPQLTEPSKIHLRRDQRDTGTL